MALATQCPHCRTTFRVAQDQLKLRAGLVRCGNCKEVFNGIEHLLSPELPTQVVASTGASASDTAPVSAPEDAQGDTPVHRAAADSPQLLHEAAPEPESTSGFIDFFDLIKNPAETGPAPSPEVEVSDGADAAEDPLQRMTLIHLEEHAPDSDGAAGKEPELEQSSTTAHGAEEPDPLDLAIEDLQRKPTRGARGPKAGKVRSTSESDEPGFVTSGRRRRHLGRTMRILTALGSFILLIGVLAQATYMLRNQIAARLPESRPSLERACAVLGCSVGLPAQIDAIAIESSELQTLAAKDTFLLSTLLRNHSQTAQAWPNIELTLNDASDKMIARRVFAPRDYLPPVLEPSKGIDPASEQPIKIFFELAQLKASGYRVYLFYP